jgi:WD40 repeat protein
MVYSAERWFIKVKVLFEDFIIRENEMWFFSKTFNGLMKMNIFSGKVDMISKIPLYKYEENRLVSKIIDVGDRLFCIPMDADEIWIYSITKDSWKSIGLDTYSEKKIWGKFFQAFLLGNELYLMPSKYSKIAIVDIETEKIDYIAFEDERIKAKQAEINDCYFRTDIAKVDEKIYLASCVDNRVLVIDTKDKACSLHCVGKSSNRYSGIIYECGQFWLSPRKDGNVVIWDGGDDYEEIIIPQLEDAFYMGIISYDDCIVISGLNECGNIIINKRSHEITVKDGIYYLANKVTEDGKYHVAIQTNGVVEIENENEDIREFACEINDDEVVRFIDLNILHKESASLPLDMFLKGI